MEGFLDAVGRTQLTSSSGMDGTEGSGGPSRLTPVQWLICAIACLGFACDLYESLMLPLIVRPALTALGNLKPGTSEFNLWVGLLFYVPNLAGAFLVCSEDISPIFSAEGAFCFGASCSTACPHVPRAFPPP